VGINRRDLLSSSAVLAAVGLAGCNALGDSTDTGNETESGGASAPRGADVTTDTAVAAEWNAMRARLWDALALGVAGDTDGGAAVAQATFARFEEATGQYGAHEALESTGSENYEGFESALGELRSAFQSGDPDAAREATMTADARLADAQRSVVSDATAAALDLQLFGATAQDAAGLAATDALDPAGSVAGSIRARFEDASVHDTVESAAPDAYESFEGALSATVEAANAGDAEGVRTNADAAFTAALDGSYAVAETEAAAGAGHVAAFQARGWDAAALAGSGGPSTAFAHAAGLTLYRARVQDARWLAARGETDRAATMVGDVFAHFEGARAHEALEEADGEAYEGFEAGLSALTTAIEEGKGAAADEALAQVDTNLVVGIEALAGSNAPLLEAAFFRARFADAREQYRRGEASAAANVASRLFERFEANELDLHETVEETSEELYTRFEEDHLAALVDAYESSDDAAVETHHEGVQSTLLEFETTAGTTATVSGAEAAYIGARGFDAAVLATLGDADRATAIAQAAFQHFEAGAGGYHEALEAADEAVYESFEEALGGISAAAEDGGDVYGAVTTFNAEVLASVYAIVGSGGGGANGEAATAVVQAAFARFEEARVHELLETADRNAYETFEAGLDAYITALDEGGDVASAAETFAQGAQYAQFALVDGVEDLPLDLDLAGMAGGGEGGHGGGESSDLSGGPNVVEGVPEDADHVVDMTAVAFEPKQLTVQVGDTVAWKHVGGEAHVVFAYEDEIPEGATYWASGGFESQSAAESGWEAGEGAVQSGQSYVYTFETEGTHGYYCLPHEAAGMVGSVVVE